MGIGHAHEIEHALYGAVLAARAVQHVGRGKRERRRHLGLYLLPIGVITACGVVLALQEWGGTHPAARWLLGLAALLVASELGIVLTNWIATLVVQPHPLPRLDFRTGIPPEAATLVVVPTLAGTTDAIDAPVWGMIFDKFTPDRWDVIGALVALAGVSIIMFAPRAA